MPLIPRIVVADSSTWIDLHVGGILVEALRLPFDWRAADAVLAELNDPDGSTLLGLGVRSHPLAGGDLAEVFRLGGLYRSLSAVDRICLVLARSLSALLLTSDGPLRRVAEAEGLAVRGSLWLLDELVERRIMAAAQAADALRAMIRSGRRFPVDEARRRLSTWNPE